MIIIVILLLLLISLLLLQSNHNKPRGLLPQKQVETCEKGSPYQASLVHDREDQCPSR